MSRKPSKMETLYQADCLKLTTFSTGCLLKVLPKKQTLRDMSYLVARRDSDGMWCSVNGPTNAPGGPIAGNVVMLIDQQGNGGSGPARSLVLFNSTFFLMPPHLLEKI